MMAIGTGVGVRVVGIFNGVCRKRYIVRHVISVGKISHNPGQLEAGA